MTLKGTTSVAREKRSVLTYRAAVATLFLVIALLSIASQRQKSATFDEPINLFHGLQALATHDVSVPMDYAPLVRVMAAGSVKLARVPLTWPRDVPWVPGILPQVAQRVLYRQNDADRLLFWGRLALVPLQLILAWGVFAFARRLWGASGALIALLLCALSPSLLAHGRLITADFPVTVFIFLAHLCAWRAAARLTLGRLVASGLFLGAAMLAKFSGLFAAPVLLLLFVGRVALGGPWDMQLVPCSARHSLRGKGTWIVAAGSFALVAAVGVLVVWGFYGFRYECWERDDPERVAKSALVEQLEADTLPDGPVRTLLLDTADHLRVLPRPYLLGVRYTFKHMERRLSYFRGERSIEGSAWYFPVTFLLKTPLALLLLLVLVLVLVGAAAVRGRLAADPVSVLFLVAFPVLYFASCLLSHINLGQRYLLPIYPFLFVVAGAAGVWLHSRWGRLAVGALLTWFAASSLAVFPDYLTYFNVLAGGPSGGMRWLGDSNLDWGQDLKRLKPWMDAHGVERIKLGYFGTALPEYYGISYEWLPSVGYLNDQPGTRVIHEGDYLAVSATCLQGFYFDDMQQYRFLDKFTPVDVIGHTLFIYHITRQNLREGPRHPRPSGPWPGER